mmetsp:Transcript_16393/g.30459  ORF Transcript_16393/g.30459 Transcript_16393/m.30459 type:complete len:103 (-) Transcript_16393:139-447(-)
MWHFDLYFARFELCNEGTDGPKIRGFVTKEQTENPLSQHPIVGTLSIHVEDPVTHSLCFCRTTTWCFFLDDFFTCSLDDEDNILGHLVEEDGLTQSRCSWFS